MIIDKKWIAAAVICGGLGIGWKVMTAAVVLPPKNFAARVTPHQNSFAETLNHQVASVTRLASKHAKPVIFDNDAAIDDALALILIGNDPAVALQAITVSGTGEAHARQGAVNMAAVAAVMGKSQVPVAFGRAEPLTKAGKPFPSSLRKLTDNMLAGTSALSVASVTVTSNAVELMQQVIKTSKEKVTILATGPLTNIAEFIVQYPQLTAKIEKIVVMGGALNVPGNIEPVMPGANNQVSEWNFYADPAAAHKVFAAGIPITLVSLDATYQVHVTPQFYKSMRKQVQPEIRLGYALLKHAADHLGEDVFYQKYSMWDALAAMVLIDPTIAKTKVMSLKVSADNGQVVLAAKGERCPAITMVTEIMHPDHVLTKYIALVKSNHIFAQRKFYPITSPNRMRAHA